MAEADDTRSDFEKVQDVIKEQVKGYFDELASNFKPETSVVSKQTEQQQLQDQLKQTLDPFIQPGLSEAKFTASDAKDYVDFYTGNSMAAEFKDEVEKVFAQMAKDGRPTTRSTILRYLIGREAVDEPEKYAARQETRRKADLDRARGAADFGADSASREKADNDFKRFKEYVEKGDYNDVGAQLKEMEKALEGVAF